MEENSRTQGQVYQLRIQLNGISSPIWRRILVAADCTIAELHQTIQLAMGWTDEHLHRFTIRGQWFGVPREGGLHFSPGLIGCDWRSLIFGRTRASVRLNSNKGT